MKTRKLIIIAIIYVIILVSLNVIPNTILSQSNLPGTGEINGIGERMESTVVGPSFIVDYVGVEVWEIMWIVIMIVPGIIIGYKFYTQIKISKQEN